MKPLNVQIYTNHKHEILQEVGLLIGFATEGCNEEIYPVGIIQVMSEPGIDVLKSIWIGRLKIIL